MSVLDKDTTLTFPHVLIIDASAGSGKTETLAQRFVQFLISSHIANNALSNILAITFTNNAAREMKERIMKWLKICALGLKSREQKEVAKLVSMTPRHLAPRASEVVDAIIDRYSDFHIQTIDSFMTRILHASAIELGLPLHSDITDSYTNMVDLALSAMLRDLHTDIPDEKIGQFLDLLQHEAGSSFVWDPTWKLEQRFHEFLTAEKYAQIFQSNLADSRLVINRMYEKGYLKKLQSDYYVHPLIYRSLVKVLKLKNILI